MAAAETTQTPTLAPMPDAGPDRSPAATVLGIAIVANIVLAFVIVSMTSRSGLWWRFSTFTYEVNLLAAAYFLWALAKPAAARRLSGLRGAVVLYVVVAGVIWNVYLTEMSMGYTPQNIMLHVVSPILVGLDWLLIGRSQEHLTWWHPLAWLAYPLVYLIGVLVYLNSERGRFLYYFLDVDQIGLAGLARNVVLLAIGFAALGYLVLGIGRLAAAARRIPA